MRKRNLCAAVLCGVVGLSLAACVPDLEKEEVTSTESTRNGLFQDKNASVEEVQADLAQLAEDYAPVVRTLEDGTQVQLTPDHPNSQVYQWNSPSSYNTYFLDADNRGCSSCHQEGLGKLVDEELSWRHIPVMNGLGTEINAKDCRMCHNEYSYDVYGAFQFGTEYSFGQLIHGIHRSDSFTGDCMSCHAATADGKGMRLWEDAKYDILGGINSVENVQGEFSYDQDVAVGESLALANWGQNTGEAWNKALTDEEIPADTRDNWEITVSGMVDNPYTITLGELIKEAPSETFYAKLDCTLNNPSGEMLINFEAKAIPMSWVLEKAGVQEGATTMASVANVDNSHRVVPLEEMEKGAWLLYEINGRPLKWKDGGPVRTFYPGSAADSSCRFLDEIVVGDETPNNKEGFAIKGTPFTEDAWRGKLEGSDDIFANKPNVAICNIHEGQIVPVNQPFVFEGYADAFDEKVVAVEFSMDRGETWTRFDTSDSDVTKLVYWKFSYIPLDPGAQVLQVRAISESGLVSAYPDEIMINAKEI